jgi:hypothetical protein
VLVPALLLAVNLVLLPSYSRWFAGGATRAERIVLRDYVVHIAIIGAFAAGAFVSVRLADHNRAWRVGAWSCTLLVVAAAALR